MVAHVAALDPETAAKIVQPMMLVCSKRPGSRESHGARPLNMSSESRVRNRISPIQTKSGSAVSVHEDSDPQTVTAIASPTGRLVKSSMPSHATPRSESPIHRPLPSSMNSSTIRSAVMSASTLLDRLHVVLLAGASRRHRPAADHAYQVVEHRHQQHDRAERHADLRNPQRRRVVALRDVVELVGLEHQPHAEPGERPAEEGAREVAPDLEGAAKAAAETI